MIEFKALNDSGMAVVFLNQILNEIPEKHIEKYLCGAIARVDTSALRDKHGIELVRMFLSKKRSLGVIMSVYFTLPTEKGDFVARDTKLALLRQALTFWNPGSATAASTTAFRAVAVAAYHSWLSASNLIEPETRWEKYARDAKRYIRGVEQKNILKLISERLEEWIQTGYSGQWKSIKQWLKPNLPKPVLRLLCIEYLMRVPHDQVDTFARNLNPNTFS